jgi:hypothetical protein
MKVFILTMFMLFNGSESPQLHTKVFISQEACIQYKDNITTCITTGHTKETGFFNTNSGVCMDTGTYKITKDCEEVK